MENEVIDMEAWRYGNMETCKYGEMETWRHEDIKRETENVSPGDLP
jgi:hypothetical protein